MSPESGTMVNGDGRSHSASNGARARGESEKGAATGSGFVI
jgi:hypothetical protein